MISRGRIWSERRPSLRIAHHQDENDEDEDHAADDDDETGDAGFDLRGRVCFLFEGLIFAHFECLRGSYNRDLLGSHEGKGEGVRRPRHTESGSIDTEGSEVG